MKIKLLMALLCVYGWSFAQIKFETGYYITNSGEKTEGLIKNVDWNSNPTTFQYKNSESDEVKTWSLKDVKEFKVYNGAKFVRAEVKLDRSSHILSRLSNQRAPEFKNETLFLKEMVDGNVRLYKYSDGNLIKFFLQTNDGKIDQLLYKPFQFDNDKIAYNKDFRKQLEESFTCTNENQRKIANVEYVEKELVDLFIAQNKCLDPDYTVSEQKKSRKININIRPRVNISSLDLTLNSGPLYTDLGRQTNFGVGGEFEYFLPFNKNRWAVIAEPNYRYFKNEVTQDLNYSYPATLKTTVDYSTIELPIGLRYYMHLNSSSKFFINAQYVADLPLNAKIEIYRKDDSAMNSTLEPQSDPAFAFGLGYKYRNKYGAEFRFFTKRGITNNYILYSSNYETTSFILSYNIF